VHPSDDRSKFSVVGKVYILCTRTIIDLKWATGVSEEGAAEVSVAELVTEEAWAKVSDTVPVKRSEGDLGLTYLRPAGGSLTDLEVGGPIRPIRTRLHSILSRMRLSISTRGHRNICSLPRCSVIPSSHYRVSQHT